MFYQKCFFKRMFQFYERDNYSDEKYTVGLQSVQLINFPISNKEQLPDASPSFSTASTWNRLSGSG